MTQNQRACFIFYDITINLNSCVPEKNEVFSMSQRPRFSSTKISGHISLTKKIKQQQ